MAKEVTVIIEEEQILNGVSQVVQVGHITRAYPANILVNEEWIENVSGVGEYARLHIYEGGYNYLWSGNLDDIDENTDEYDPRWILE